MNIRVACIVSLGLAATLAGCQSAQQTAWLSDGPSNSVMLGMVSTPTDAGADATGAIMLGAGDALGFQLYMNHVAYVHATTSHEAMQYATGASDRPGD